MRLSDYVLGKQKHHAAPNIKTNGTIRRSVSEFR